MSNKRSGVGSEEVISSAKRNLGSLVKEIIKSGSFDRKNIKDSVTLILARMAAARQLSNVEYEQLLHNPVIKQKLFELIEEAVGEEQEARHAHQRIEEWQSAIEQQTQEKLQQGDAQFQQQQTAKAAEFELQKQKQRAEELARSLAEKEQRLVSAKAKLKILYQEYNASVQELVAVVEQGVTVMEQVGLGLTHITSDQVTDLILHPTELLEQLRLLGAIEMAQTIEQSEEDSVNKKLRAAVLLDRSKSLSPEEVLANKVQTLLEKINAEFDALADEVGRPDDAAKGFRTFMQTAQKLGADVGEKLRKVEQQLQEVQEIKMQLTGVESDINVEADEFLAHYAAEELSAEHPNDSFTNAIFKSQSVVNAKSSLFAKNGKTSPLPEPSAPPAPRENETAQEQEQGWKKPKGFTGSTDD